MAKKLSLQEVLDHFTDQENSEEETTEDESYSEDALQDILEEENITEQAENLATTEEEQSSDFEGPAEVDVTFWSKDGNLSWSSSPTEKKGRLSTENVIKMTPGLTKYATSRIEDIKSCFNLFLTEPIENIVISMTNLQMQGKHLQGTCTVYLWVMWISSKWPVARHIQMLVSVTCMSSNNNQVFVDVVLYMAMPMFLFFYFLSQGSDLLFHDIVSVWQCQCAGYITEITVLVCCSIKCYNVKNRNVFFLVCHDGQI